MIWQPKERVGIVVGYDSFNLNVDVEKSDITGSLDRTCEGLQICFNIAC